MPTTKDVFKLGLVALFGLGILSLGAKELNQNFRKQPSPRVGSARELVHQLRGAPNKTLISARSPDRASPRWEIFNKLPANPFSGYSFPGYSRPAQTSAPLPAPARLAPVSSNLGKKKTAGVPSDSLAASDRKELEDLLGNLSP